MKTLFQSNPYWSWYTFVLYLSISFLVVYLCKKGALVSSTRKIKVKFISNKNYDIKCNIYYVSAVIILTILATLRSKFVGTDTQVYVLEFQTFSRISININTLLSFHELEPGYQLLLKITKLISDNYRILFLVVYMPLSYAYVSFVRYFYKKGDNMYALLVFIFYFVSNMSGMRSAVGTIFLLYSFIEIDKKKYFKAILLTFFASTFHYTMIYNFFIIFMTMIFSKPQLRKRKWIWILGCIGSIIFCNLGFKIFLDIFQNTKYSFYTRTGGTTSIFGSLFLVFYVLIGLWVYKDILANKRYQQLLLITFSFMLTYPLVYLSGAYRIPYYYIMPRLVIWDYAIKKIDSKLSKKGQYLIRIIYIIIIILFLLLRFIKMSENGNFSYII